MAIAPYAGPRPSLRPGGLGLISAALGVGAMRAAALLERAFAATRAPQWARPGARRPAPRRRWRSIRRRCSARDTARSGSTFRAALSAATLAALLALKLSASLVSLASGFRGGLFFASLFAGALLGKLYALGVDAALPTLALDPTACIMAGMGTLSVAVVGGPLTMTFLVLESTGDLGVAGGVLAACIATSLAVRATFGYSFTTWRLHLRGESIRGAQDVGWLRDLTVARLMVSAPPTTPAETSVRAFRAAYPLGSAHVVVAVDEAGRYRGLVLVPEAHAVPLADNDDGGPISAVARLPQTSLHPDVDARYGAGDFRRRAGRHARRDRARDRRRRRPARRGLRRAPLRPGNRPWRRRACSAADSSGRCARRQPQAPVSSSGVKSFVKFCQVLSSFVNGSSSL